MKSSYAADLVPDTSITSFFLVCEKELRCTREGKQFLRLSDIVGHADIDDGRAQVFGVLRQQMPVGRHLAVFRQIEKAIDTGLVQSREARVCLRVVGAPRVFAGQHSTRNDPVGIGQRSVNGPWLDWFCHGGMLSAIG